MICMGRRERAGDVNDLGRGDDWGGRVNYCFFACLEQFLSLATDHFLYGGSRFYGI